MYPAVLLLILIDLSLPAPILIPRDTVSAQRRNQIRKKNSIKYHEKSRTKMQFNLLNKDQEKVLHVLFLAIVPKNIFH